MLGFRRRFVASVSTFLCIFYETRLLSETSGSFRKCHNVGKLMKVSFWLVQISPQLETQHQWRTQVRWRSLLVPNFFFSTQGSPHVSPCQRWVAMRAKVKLVTEFIMRSYYFRIVNQMVDEYLYITDLLFFLFGISSRRSFINIYEPLEEGK